MKINSIKNSKYIRIIGIILFFYILSKINLQELFIIIKNVKPFYFLSAIILLLISFIIGILKWKILIDSQNIKVSFKVLTEAFLKSFFLGTITPGKLGELWKAKYLKEAVNISTGKAFYTALVDRLIDIIIVIVIAIAGIILLLSDKIKIEWIVIVLFFLLSAVIVYFLVRKKNIQRIFKILVNFFIPSPMKKKIELFFNEFFQGMKKLNFTLFLKLLGYSIVYYVISVMSYYFLALSLNINITFFNLFLIVALV
ncbi:MAG TPA: lysylphosphatidylglycerol synthase transmembrane domain-containing protein, partial [Candidatus Paceibacterota bacterium]|nr:lysylphosphatidylglycerol synthase transmembrane domain-containing protein [Candidatus Paceibacterota bacterium]